MFLLVSLPLALLPPPTSELKAEPEYDEETGEQIEMENDADSELNFHICTAFNALIKSQKADFLAIGDLIVPPMQQLVASGNEEFEKIAIYIFDDLIEFCGPQAAALVPTFVPYLLKCAVSDSVVVRQPSCYGLGICAKFVDPSVMAPYCTEAIRVLMSSATRADAHEELSLACTDNSISAIGKFIQFQGAGGSFNPAEVVPHFFALLPLEEDDTEGPNVYSLLCSLVEMCVHLVGGWLTFFLTVSVALSCHERNASLLSLSVFYESLAHIHVHTHTQTHTHTHTHTHAHTHTHTHTRTHTHIHTRAHTIT